MIAFKQAVCLILIAFVGVLTSILVQLNETSPIRYELETPNLSVLSLAENGISTCHHPMILRNALKLCNNDDDDCISEIRQRVDAVFGEKYLTAYPMSALGKPNELWERHGADESVNVTVHEFLTNPKYDRYVVHALPQLGDANDYEKFLAFGNVSNVRQRKRQLAEGEFDSTEEKQVHKELFTALSTMPVPRNYMGAQTFFSRGVHTGSHLHYAWGTNVFLMLSGKKHWLLVHPDWMHVAGCIPAHNGMYGTCYPNGYTGEEVSEVVSFENIKENMYKAGVPRDAVYDITLNPGDLFVNCPLWPHAVENKTPETVAFSFRFYGGVLAHKWRKSSFVTFFKSVRTALADALFGSGKDKTSFTGMIGKLIKGNVPTLLDDKKLIGKHGVFTGEKNIET